MKKNPTLWWIIGLTVLIIGLFGWSQRAQNYDPNVIARNGLHWHSEIALYVKGEKIEIPKNIGIGAVHQPMHTHDDLPVLHLEFQGMVRKQDLMLGQFFKNWGKDFNSFGSHVTMTVNGKENTEFENYQMKNGDKIELRYE